MAQYTAIFTKPYEDGYEDLPSQNTPITAQTLNDKDAAIEHIEDFLNGNEFPAPEDESAWDGAVSDVEYNKQNGYLAKNLFNKNTSINGYRIDSSGQPYAAPNYTLSDWIPVKPSTDYIRNTDILETSTSVALYKADKTFITRVPSSSSGRFTTTADTAYIRSAIYGNELETTQIEEGTVSSQYMQYAPSNIELANSKADITSIGTDESGRTTASKAYGIGEHFYKDGKFCTAKTAIASGATFTLNTNYVEGDIAKVIDENLPKKMGTYSVDSGSPATISLDARSYYLLYSYQPYTGGHGVFGISIWGSSVIVIQTISGDNALTITAGTGQITVESTTARFLTLVKIDADL